MLHRLSVGLLASVITIAPLPTMAEEDEGEDFRELTKQSCLGVRALIDLERGFPAAFCKDLYREKDWLEK